MLKTLLKSFGHGFAGLGHVCRVEANMRWHLLAALAVSLAGFWLKLSCLEWVMIVGCIGIIFALECFNTAIERLADRITTEADPLIKQAKDAAAGGVLIMSIACAVIGSLIFIPKILEVFD
jgi:diacylglycerol kinase